MGILCQDCCYDGSFEIEKTGWNIKKSRWQPVQGFFQAVIVNQAAFTSFYVAATVAQSCLRELCYASHVMQLCFREPRWGKLCLASCCFQLCLASCILLAAFVNSLKPAAFCSLLWKTPLSKLLLFSSYFLLATLASCLFKAAFSKLRIASCILWNGDTYLYFYGCI